MSHVNDEVGPARSTRCIGLMEELAAAGVEVGVRPEGEKILCVSDWISLILTAHDVPNDQVVYANATAAEFLGASQAGLSAMGHARFLEFLHEEDRTPFMARLHGVAQGQSPGSVESATLRYRTAAGAVHWVEQRMWALPHDSANARYVISAAYDVNERHHAEQARHIAEARYQAVVEDQTDLISRHQPDGTITFANAAFARFFGLRENAHLGLNILTLLPEAERAPVAASWAALSPAHAVMTFEQNVAISPREQRWVEWTMRAIFGSDGVLTEVQAVGRDTTVRRRLAEGLLASEALYHAVFETSNDGIAVSDPTTRQIIDVNDAWCTLFQCDRKATIATDINLLLPMPATQANGAKATGNSVVPGMLRGIECLCTSRSGRTFWADVERRSIDLADGHRLLTVVRDITARKRWAETLSRNAAEFSHANRLAVLGKLSADIAHEINQPLGAIAVLADGLCHAGQRGQVSVADLLPQFMELSAQSLRAGHIIQRLKRLAQKRATRRSSFQMASVTAAALDLLRTRITESGVSVDLAGDADAGQCWLVGDSIQIQQVLVNLITNAVDAMQGIPSEQRRLRIRIVQAGVHGVHVVVEDTGPGPPTVDAERIFEPFWSTKPDGLGLGLAICRTILENHGGRIWAAPVADQKLAFHFTLPMEPLETDGRTTSLR